MKEQTYMHRFICIYKEICIILVKLFPPPLSLIRHIESKRHFSSHAAAQQNEVREKLMN